MAGVYELDITESAPDLKHLLAARKTATDKEFIQLLYLLKTEQAQTVQAAAALLGRLRVTVQKWLSRYRSGGLAGKGQQRAIPDTNCKQLGASHSCPAPKLTPQSVQYHP